MDGAKWTEIARADIDIKTGRNYKLKVNVKGDRIQFFVDSRMVLETTDSDYATGFAGVRVVDVAAAFDDIKIQSR